MSDVAIAMVRWYQRRLSPPLQRLGVRCRFYPSCSNYALLALQKYDVWTALRLTAGRLRRCRHDNYASCVDMP